MGGYEFLMKHYNEGDRICTFLCFLMFKSHILTDVLGLFGFSRGAYTARALAGMLNKVGLLPPDNVRILCVLSYSGC